MKKIKRSNARTCYRYRYSLTFANEYSSHWIEGEIYFASLHKKQGHRKAYSLICDTVRQAKIRTGAIYADMEVYCIEERISDNWSVFHLFQESDRRNQVDYGIAFNNWKRIA